MKVLIVDDSGATRFMVKRLLKQTELPVEEICEAADGQQALEQLALHPDVGLALVDWNMPVMNGLDFVLEARKSHPTEKLKIVMVTTETEMMQVVKALQAGVDEYVMKPFTCEILGEKLRILGMLQN